MHNNLIKGLSIFSIIILGSSMLQAQSKKQQPRFSHKGIKAALGFGDYEMPSGSHEEHGGGVLSLGYGFSDHTTLWLSLTGTGEENQPGVTEFAGVEISFQYKFMPHSALQPYGKIGLGGYGLQESGTDPTLLGGGFNFALGADYFFSRHFGIGLELNFKDIEYSKISREENGETVISDLHPRLNRDSRALLITLTIQ